MSAGRFAEREGGNEMKVGDQIFSTKKRRNDIATIKEVKMDIKEWTSKRTGQTRNVNCTTYVARYDDGEEISFAGYLIGKIIFKYEKPDGQMNLADFMNVPE